MAFVSLPGNSRDMSREMQDVDLAEVKPLVEKGEVSGDAPGSIRSHARSYVDIGGHAVQTRVCPRGYSLASVPCFLVSKTAEGQEVS